MGLALQPQHRRRKILSIGSFMQLMLCTTTLTIIYVSIIPASAQLVSVQTGTTSEGLWMIPSVGSERANSIIGTAARVASAHFKTHAVPIEFDSFIYIPPYSHLTQCVQIVYSSWLSPQYCSLSPHCGSILYRTISTTYWGKTGVCTGAPTQPRFISSLSKTVRVPKYWYPIFSINWEETIINQYRFVELQDQYWLLILNDRYHIVPRYLLELYPTVNKTLDFVPPKIINTVDGRWCTPQYTYTDVWRIIGEGHTDPQSAIINYPILANFKSNHNVSTHQLSQTTSWTLELGNVYLNDYPLYLTECPSYDQTTNVLPFSVSSIAHSIGHVFLTMLLMLRHTLNLLFEWVYSMYEILRETYRVDEILLLSIGFMFYKFSFTVSLLLSTVIILTVFGISYQ